MRIKNRVAIVGLVAGVLGGGVAGVALTSPGVAHGDTSTTTTTKDGAKRSTATRDDFLERALAPLVANGTITQQQADAVIQALQDARPDHLGRGGPFGAARGIGVFGDVFDAAAKALGMSTDDLRAALRDGKSIADIAKDEQVDTSKVVDAMVAAVHAELDQAVKDGKLTQAQADEKLDNVRSRITAIVNGDFPALRAPRGFFGHGPGRWHPGDGTGGEGPGGGETRPSSMSTVFSGTA
jgi:polyhydroxyalkanoate synthesis regulator phasin